MPNRKCFHTDCPNEATTTVETSGEIELPLCFECSPRYADAEGFDRLYRRAMSEKTDEAFDELNAFYKEIFSDEKPQFDEFVSDADRPN